MPEPGKIKALETCSEAEEERKAMFKMLDMAKVLLERFPDDFSSMVVVAVPHGHAAQGYNFLVSQGDRYHQYASLHGAAHDILRGDCESRTVGPDSFLAHE